MIFRLFFGKITSEKYPKKESENRISRDEEF